MGPCAAKLLTWLLDVLVDTRRHGSPGQGWINLQYCWGTTLNVERRRRAAGREQTLAREAQCARDTEVAAKSRSTSYTSFAASQDLSSYITLSHPFVDR
jgi:hypothetical protein